MEGTKEPGDRVKIIRQEAHLTQENFGRRLGVSKVAVSKIENKVNSLSDQMRRSICREFKINEEWLLSGTGEMHTLPEADLITRFSCEYGLDSLETTILLEYVKLNPQSRQVFRSYLKRITERLNDAHTDLRMMIHSTKSLILTCIQETGTDHHPASQGTASSEKLP